MWIGTAFMAVLFVAFIERRCIYRTRMSISVTRQMFASADAINIWRSFTVVRPALRRPKPPREKVDQGRPASEAVAHSFCLHGRNLS